MLIWAPILGISTHSPRGTKTSYGSMYLVFYGWANSSRFFIAVRYKLRSERRMTLFVFDLAAPQRTEPVRSTEREHMNRNWSKRAAAHLFLLITAQTLLLEFSHHRDARCYFSHPVNCVENRWGFLANFKTGLRYCKVYGIIGKDRLVNNSLRPIKDDSVQHRMGIVVLCSAQIVQYCTT